MRRCRLRTADIVGLGLGMTAGAIGVAIFKLRGAPNPSNARNDKGCQRLHQRQSRARNIALHCNDPMGNRNACSPKMGMIEGLPRLAFTMPEINAITP